MTQALVRFEPHGLAAVAHSRNAEVAAPRARSPPLAVTMSMYCCVAGHVGLLSGVNDNRMYRSSPKPYTFQSASSSCKLASLNQIGW